MLYKEKVPQIDSGNEKIDEFDKDTLFLNIYHIYHRSSKDEFEKEMAEKYTLIYLLNFAKEKLK